MNLKKDKKKQLVFKVEMNFIPTRTSILLIVRLSGLYGHHNKQLWENITFMEWVYFLQERILMYQLVNMNKKFIWNPRLLLFNGNMHEYVQVL
jgi:hypothetical protein